jgi:hypothetical protein
MMKAQFSLTPAQFFSGITPDPFYCRDLFFILSFWDEMGEVGSVS